MPISRDWFAVAERLLRGDALAFFELARLVNTHLASWNAYDFAQEWDDLIQEVVTAAALAVREGRVREPAAFGGYVRAIARNEFANRLKAHLRLREDQTVPWEELIEAGVLDPPDATPELRRDLLDALARLPAKKREAVCAVYLEGRTYPEAARATALPLGTLKRYLGEALAQVRRDLEGPIPCGWGSDPIQPVVRTDRVQPGAAGTSSPASSGGGA